MAKCYKCNTDHGQVPARLYLNPDRWIPISVCSPETGKHCAEELINNYVDLIFCEWQDECRTFTEPERASSVRLDCRIKPVAA